MTTLREALKILGAQASKIIIRKSTAGELLGKYRGIIPSGKTATAFIKGQRTSLCGKVK